MTLLFQSLQAALVLSIAMLIISYNSPAGASDGFGGYSNREPSNPRGWQCPGLAFLQRFWALNKVKTGIKKIMPNQ